MQHDHGHNHHTSSALMHGAGQQLRADIRRDAAMSGKQALDGDGLHNLREAIVPESALDEERQHDAV